MIRSNLMIIILGCDVVVHKQCTSTLSDHCYPAIQKKIGANKTKRTGSGGKCETELFEGNSSQADQLHSVSITTDKVQFL